MPTPPSTSFASMNRRIVQRLLKLVSSLSVVLFLGWIWIRWPEWTLQNFVASASAGDFQAASELLDPAWKWEHDRTWTLATIGGPDLRTIGLWRPPSGTERRAAIADRFRRMGETPTDAPTDDSERGEDWLLLARVDEINFYQSTSRTERIIPGFLLPEQIWREWFAARNIEYAPRTAMEYLRGSASLRTIEMRCQFTARFGRVAVLGGQAEYEDFLKSRREPIGTRTLESEYGLMRSRYITYGSDEKKEREYFGPRLRTD